MRLREFFRRLFRRRRRGGLLRPTDRVPGQTGAAAEKPGVPAGAAAPSGFTPISPPLADSDSAELAAPQESPLPLAALEVVAPAVGAPAVVAPAVVAPAVDPASSLSRDRSRLRALTDALLSPATADTLLRLARPAIVLRSAEPDGEPAASQIGGSPAMPRRAPWPHREGEPLSFLGQIRLEEVAPYDVDHELPAAGLLLFFYGGAEEAWGFDPADRPSWRVLLVDPATAAVRAAPVGAEVFAPRRLHPGTAITLPDRWSGSIQALVATEPAVDEVLARFDELRPRVRHQLLGWPRDGHDAMQRVCRLAANGVYAGADAGPAAGAQTEGRADRGQSWRLLLQLDSDDDAEMVWGDECRLHFWLPSGDFDPAAAWLVWRCG